MAGTCRGTRDPWGRSKRSGWVDSALSTTTTSSPSRTPRLAASPVTRARSSSWGLTTSSPYARHRRLAQQGEARPQVVALGPRILGQQAPSHQCPHDAMGRAHPQRRPLGDLAQTEVRHVGVEAGDDGDGPLDGLRPGPRLVRLRLADHGRQSASGPSRPTVAAMPSQQRRLRRGHLPTPDPGPPGGCRRRSRQDEGLRLLGRCSARGLRLTAVTYLALPLAAAAGRRPRATPWSWPARRTGWSRDGRRAGEGAVRSGVARAPSHRAPARWSVAVVRLRSNPRHPALVGGRDRRA